MLDMPTYIQIYPKKRQDISHEYEYPVSDEVWSSFL